LQLSYLQLDTVWQSQAFFCLPSRSFPAPIPPTSSILTALAIKPTCSHVCGQYVGIISTACFVADFGRIDEPNCGKSKVRGARIRACPEIGIGAQTLIRKIVPVTGPICAPLPPSLHSRHKFRSPFSKSLSTVKPYKPYMINTRPTRKALFH
jgi:hypothetical protein